RPARSADAGIDDGEMDAERHVGERVREHQRALEDAARPDAVRDVDDAGVGCDARDHPVAGADEVVLQPEVAEEGDDHYCRTRSALRVTISLAWSPQSTTSTLLPFAPGGRHQVRRAGHRPSFRRL